LNPPLLLRQKLRRIPLPKRGGNYVVTLKSGERYIGNTADQALTELAKAVVSTKEYARTWKDKAEAAVKPADPVVTPTVTPSQPDVLTAEQFFAQAAENPQNAVKSALAGALGMSAQQFDAFISSLPNVVDTVNTQTATAQSEQVVGQFLSRAEDFPNTEEATGKLLGKLQAMGIPEGSRITPETLQAAHLLCIQGKDYTPLNNDQIQAVRNKAMGQVTQRTSPTPAPVITPQAPNTGNTEVNPWDKNISLEQLREMAINQR
jgi:hypothetical protein